MAPRHLPRDRSVHTQPVLFVTGRQDLPFLVRPEIRALHPSFGTGSFKVVDVDEGHGLLQEGTEQVGVGVMTHLVGKANSLAAAE